MSVPNENVISTAVSPFRGGQFELGGVQQSTQPLVRSVSNLSSPAPTSTGKPVGSAGRRGTPRSRVKRSQSVLVPEIDRVEEQQRWDDVRMTREASGLRSPLRIHPNPLRLFEPERVQSLTGRAPVFDVVLEDPFLATPDRKQQRAMLNRQSSELAFSFGGRAPPGAGGGEAAGPGSSFRLPTPRLSATDEAALPLLHAVAPLPTSSASGAAGATPGRKRGGARRLKSRTAPSQMRSERASGGTGSSEADRLVDVPEGQRTPRWGTLRGLVGWVLQHGSRADHLALATGHRLFCSARALVGVLRAVFVSDATPDRCVRVSALAFIGVWLDVLPFFSPGAVLKPDVLEQLHEFLAHTASLHSKMLAQRHAQAPCYAAAPALLARLDALAAARHEACTVALASDARYLLQADGSLRPSAAFAALALAVDVDPPAADGPRLTDWPQGVDPRRLAAALTQMDAGLLGRLSGRELIRGPRSGAVLSVGRAGAPVAVHPIVLITAFWNDLSRWAPTAVLTARPKRAGEAELIRVRAKIVRRFIDLAAELRALDNWSSLFAIVIGLGSSTLTGLKEMWRAVPSKHVTLLRELEEQCQPIANFRPYREALARCSETGTFCVPYLAIVLKDLQAVEEGNPNRDPRGLLNFEKMQLLAAAVERVRQLQAVPCPVRGVDRRLVQAIVALESRSESDLWELAMAARTAEQAHVAGQPAKWTFRKP